MKKTLTTICLFLALVAGMQAQDYRREGNTFVEVKASPADSLLMKGDQVTTYKWRDKQGKEYPIILHKYTKGEKAGRTTAYVIRLSKKSGCYYCGYFGRCHTAAWRNGVTCDLFVIDTNKLKTE